MSPSWRRSWRPESNRLVTLDLAEVTIVSREAVKCLARAEAARAVLVNSPETCAVGSDGE